jgi:AcrR family transcriptional regulator
MTTVATSSGRPGRQRSDAADAAILRATLDVLGETGYEGLTVAAVIERAGVSSATLYRRWASKAPLVAAAVASLVPEAPDLDTGSLDGDLNTFVRHVAAAITVRREDIFDSLRAERKRNPELDDALADRFLRPRLAALRGILSRAKARGEIVVVPPADVALSLVVGPLYHRAFNMGEPLTPAFVKATAAWARRALA